MRETKLEKANHDATPRHQGNLKRFVRDLHKGHEKEEKDKERAKSEVARLNGIVSGSGAGPSGSISSSVFGRGPTTAGPKAQVTPSQRKQQLAQLAEMGVAIPDEFRGDMAMAGEWQVTAERVIDQDEEKNPDAIGFGVRKRAALDEEEEEEAKEAKRRRWGNAHKTHPVDDDDADLDALLSKSISKGKNVTVKGEDDADLDALMSKSISKGKNATIKGEDDADPAFKDDDATKLELEDAKIPSIKLEPSDGDMQVSDSGLPQMHAEADVKQDEGDITGGVVFKKRKPKALRQR